MRLMAWIYPGLLRMQTVVSSQSLHLCTGSASASHASSSTRQWTLGMGVMVGHYGYLPLGIGGGCDEGMLSLVYWLIRLDAGFRLVYDSAR